MSERVYGFKIIELPKDVDGDAWAAYSLSRWGEELKFFLPSENRVFLSRSAAKAKVDIVERWGGKAVLLVSELHWADAAAVAREKKVAWLAKRRAALFEQCRGLDQQIVDIERQARPV